MPALMDVIVLTTLTVAVVMTALVALAERHPPEQAARRRGQNRDDAPSASVTDIPVALPEES